MSRRTRLLAAVLLLGCAHPALPVRAAAGAEADPFAAIAAYEMGGSRKGLYAVEQMVRAATAKPADRAAVERKLLALLTSDATVHCKWFVCRMLGLCGSAEAVPALAPLLGDKDMGHMSRYALEQIPDPAAGAALRAALDRLKGKPLVGAINSLGVRRDAQAAAALAKRLGAADPEVASAAASSLGMIGGEEAVRTLAAARTTAPAAVRPAVDDACLACAGRLLKGGESAKAAAVFTELLDGGGSRQVRLSAFAGLVAAEKEKALPRIIAAIGGEDAGLQARALRLAEGLPGSEATRAIAARLAAAPPAMQARLLGVLAARRDPAAASAVVAAAGSKDPSVRLAALATLGAVGDASAVPLLVKVATTGPPAERTAARNSLARLKGKDTGAAILALFQGGSVAVRAELIAVLALRGSRAAVPTLLAGARDADPTVRAEALKALRALADVGALPDLLTLLKDAKQNAERDAAEGAIAAVLARTTDKSKAAGPILNALEASRIAVPVHCALVRLAGRVGDARALGDVRKAVKSANPAVQDAAVRTLVNWSDAAPMADALAIAKSAMNPTHRILALRGFLRMAALPGERTAEQSLALYVDAMALATQAQEKKTVLGALAALRHPKALDMALAAMADKAVRAEAAQAAVTLASALLSSHNKQAVAALNRVAEEAKDTEAARLAQDTLRMSKLGANIAPQGKATSPDGFDSDGGAGGDQAAIDANKTTYWDEANGKRLYRLVVTFDAPRTVSAVTILGYSQHSYAPKDFEILADGKTARTVKGAKYTNNFLVVTFEEVAAKAIELKITGYYGASPAIRELGIYEAPK